MNEDSVVLESFHTPGGLKVGVLVRKVTPTSLATLICFTEPDGLYHVENRIEFDGEDPFDWTHFVHHDGNTMVEREHEAEDPEMVVPSYAEFLLVHDMLATGQERLDFVRLDEGTGEYTPASLVHRADEVALVVDDHLVNRHRVLGEEVLASDWGGAGSRPVHDLTELMTGLDDQVAIRLRMFLDA